MNTIYTSRRDRRGSVLILVVAVLALLVLMGTAYIVSARTDRANATAMSASNNVDLARDAVMAQVQQVIGSAMLDSKGNVGGYDATGTYTRTTGTGAGTLAPLAARNYDYPELGTTYGEATGNANMQDEPWLVAHLHNQGGTQNDMSMLTSAPYDPSTGTLSTSLTYSAAPGNTYVFGNVSGPQSAANALLTVVADQTVTDVTLDDKPTGRADAYINLLPFSDAAGVRYRYGVRILDTSRMANLNTGNPDDSITDSTGTNLASMRLAPSGVTTTSYFNPADASPDNLQISRGGSPAISFSFARWEPIVLNLENPSLPQFSFFDLSDELELRSYGEFGTLYTARPATSAVWPNTLGNLNSTGTIVQGKASRRNYTTDSFSRDVRPYPDPTAATPAFTLTSTSSQTPTIFTTDFGSPTAVPAKLPQSITSGTSANVWPTAANTALPCVAINSTLKIDSTTPSQTFTNPSQTNWDAMYMLAMNATNIATAMERIAGFSHRDACQFAANYVTSCWNGMMQDSNIAAATAYYFPAGPSFVDETGICVRTAIYTGTASPPAAASIATIGANFGGATDLNSTAAGANIYLGYVAQPFISEIAAQSISDGKGMGNASIGITDSAIELFNPYPVALSMQGYRLTDMSVSPFSMDLDLSKDDNNQALYIPANGYLIITTGTGTPSALAPSPSPNVVVGKYAAFALLKTGSPVLALRRPFFDRTFTANQYAVVDRAAYVGVDQPNTIFAASATATTSGSPVTLSIARTDIAKAGSMGAPGTPTLGTATGALTYNLYDRSTLTVPSLGAPNLIKNIGDFNRISRVGNHIYSSIGVTATPPGIGGPVTTDTIPALLTERMSQLGSANDPAPNSPPAASTGTIAQPNEAIIYFDFWPNPAMFQTATEYPVAFSPPTTPVPADANCDMRAVALLNCLTTIDRFSDYSISITTPNSNPDINKLRLPGKINVNTAAGDVLRAIPNMTDQMVANILAYRSGASQTYNSSMSNLPASVTASAGHGFHTLGEILVAVGTPSSATLNARDAAWASIYNLCTVRSDTFVVYGYLEAVKPNPAFPNFSTNVTNWYATNTTTTTNVSDDPHAAPTVPLIRLGRRRWVAIVDRSFCNYGASDPKYSIPRVVAIKDLPQ